MCGFAVKLWNVYIMVCSTIDECSEVLGPAPCWLQSVTAHCLPAVVRQKHLEPGSNVKQQRPHRRLDHVLHSKHKKNLKAHHVCSWVVILQLTHLVFISAVFVH